VLVCVYVKLCCVFVTLCHNKTDKSYTSCSHSVVLGGKLGETAEIMCN